MKNTSIQIIAIAVLVAFAIGFALGVIASRKFYPCTEITVPTIKTDTVTVIDTINYDRPTEVKKEIIRRDTVRIRVSPFGMDSLKVRTNYKPGVELNNLGPVDDPKIADNTGPKISTPAITKDAPTVTPDGQALTIPIERKTYQDETYKAVVEGWRPKLVSMEVYPKTQYITTVKTETVIQKKRTIWALTVGPSIGYGIDQKFTPAISATLGLVLISK